MLVSFQKGLGDPGRTQQHIVTMTQQHGAAGRCGSAQFTQSVPTFKDESGDASPAALLSAVWLLHSRQWKADWVSAAVCWQTGSSSPVVCECVKPSVLHRTIKASTVKECVCLWLSCQIIKVRCCVLLEVLQGNGPEGERDCRLFYFIITVIIIHCYEYFDVYCVVMNVSELFVNV